MINLSIEQLKELATDTNKALQSIKALQYINSKSTSILNRKPQTLEEAVLSIKNFRETGFISKGGLFNELR